jgi:hypothetical protein
MTIKKGMTGQIKSQIFVYTDEEICCDGEVITCNETFLNEGEFKVEKVSKTNGHPETLWYLDEEEWEHVEFSV